ncbi:LysE family translocator [Desulfoluna spongiiphila]|uniref:Resistance to homoserine/threonine (RhtB) family protein n=1 Tax=Desulfoluna spongiiphila TaxID=419481 RepID=A0A1G5ADU6_9BACT|nr:LysE family transporter [Desulfoluna spongiiphila]SCX76034.1 resistance to homoserine/threonine (RhtB) family protein [Desulfoluna spongiiphila]
MNMACIETLPYLSELISVSVVAMFMAISPGADFVMVTRNSMFHSRSAGIFSALGVGSAIWIHVTYSIAGLALIISRSIVLFSILKYVGAAYLIYMGWKTFTSKELIDIDEPSAGNALSNGAAFKIGFVTNALNPKTTIFFLSIFTQVVNPDTPIWMQLVYGLIISLSHVAWFTGVAVFLSHPILLQRFQNSKSVIEKVVGCVLIGFGCKVAAASHG